jgi:hypothetical protein
VRNARRATITAPSTALTVQRAGAPCRSPRVWIRPLRGVHLCGGRRRDGDLQALAEALGDVCDTVDVAAEGAHHADLDQRAHRNYWLQQVLDRHVDYMHSGFGCSTYSAALSLPSRDAAGHPIPAMGPYRSEQYPDGMPSLPDVAAARCASVNHHFQLTLYMARALTAQQKPVIIENAADCSAPGSPGYMELDGYTTATQFSVWAHPDMRAYVAETGSVVVTKALHWVGSPYRNLKSFCFNAPAYRHAAEFLALPDTLPTTGITRMRGWAPDGRTHGEIAQEYTPQLCGILHRILTAAAREAVHGCDGAAALLQSAPPGPNDEGPPDPPAPPPPPAAPATSENKPSASELSPAPSPASPSTADATNAGEHTTRPRPPEQSRASSTPARRPHMPPSDLKVGGATFPSLPPLLLPPTAFTYPRPPQAPPDTGVPAATTHSTGVPEVVGRRDAPAPMASVPATVAHTTGVPAATSRAVTLGPIHSTGMQAAVRPIHGRARGDPPSAQTGRIAEPPPRRDRPGPTPPHECTGRIAEPPPRRDRPGTG